MTRTIKIKIPIAVDSEGNWSTRGASSEAHDWEMMDTDLYYAAGKEENLQQRFLVEVEVPVPGIAVLPGVVKAEGVEQ